LPPGQQFKFGVMLHLLGQGREKRTKGNIVCPGVPRIHRHVAAGMTGNADLRFLAQPVAGITRVAIALPQMHSIRAQSLGQTDRIVDDEGNFAVRANALQRFGEPRRFMLVHAFDAILEGRNGTSIECAGKLFRESARHIKWRDQVELAGRAGGFFHHLRALANQTFCVEPL
jgi:hypothetical protein